MKLFNFVVLDSFPSSIVLNLCCFKGKKTPLFFCLEVLEQHPGNSGKIYATAFYFTLFLPA